jgi:hypothetical protein
MKQLALLLLLAIFLFSSCEKEELSGDTEFLIGTWEWVYTVETTGHSWGYTYDTIRPKATNYMEIEFQKKGILYIDYSGFIERYRISLTKEYYPSYFRINLNNKKENYISIKQINQDSITVYPLPFLPSDRFQNYYKRKN